jgi:hypothetical protein
MTQKNFDYSEATPLEYLQTRRVMQTIVQLADEKLGV